MAVPKGPTNSKRNFIDIGDLTDEFYAACNLKEGEHIRQYVRDKIALAIAQQLSVISAQLKRGKKS